MASLRLVLSACVVALATSAVDVVWKYEVTADLHNQGSASSMVVHDGNVFFTTWRCVYNFGTGACVNATGEFLNLGGSTGRPYWGYRFDGAGFTGIGYPQPPLLVQGQGGAPTSAVLLGADSAGLPEGVFSMFTASLELKGAVTCDVPVASGNRLEHPANYSSKPGCESAGACWDDGSADRCGMVATAQTVDCASPNPETEQDCSKLGCCWDSAYQPGRCFKGSPQCYAKSEDESGGWQTPRPGPQWVTLPAVVPAAGKPSIVVRTECKDYPVISGPCDVVAFSAQGTRTGKGETKELWRVPLPIKCDSAKPDEACMCPGFDTTVSDPAVGAGATFITACTAKGPALLALLLSTGQQLWAPQLLQEMSPGYEMIYRPPTPVYSERFGLVYAGLQASVVGATVSAHRADSGAQTWSVDLHGYECTSLRWVDTGVISPDGSQLVLWDSFATRAVAADTGSSLWTSSGFCAGNGHSLPGISFTASPKGEEALLVLGVDKPAKCDSTFEPGSFFVQAVRLTDGALVGRAASPSNNFICDAVPPVAVDNLWVHGDTTLPGANPNMRSTIFAVRANFTDVAQSREMLI